MHASNNLDSHSYVLERVKKPDDNYIAYNYFLKNHSQVILYYTCWRETETVF
jgi:hypothetical protein